MGVVGMWLNNTGTETYDNFLRGVIRKEIETILSKRLRSLPISEREIEKRFFSMKKILEVV